MLRRKKSRMSDSLFRRRRSNSSTARKNVAVKKTLKDTDSTNATVETVTDAKPVEVVARSSSKKKSVKVVAESSVPPGSDTDVTGQLTYDSDANYSRLTSIMRNKKFANAGTLLAKDRYYGHKEPFHKMCIEAEFKKRPWSDILDFTKVLDEGNREALHRIVFFKDGSCGWTALHLVCNTGPLEVIEDLLSLDPFGATVADDNDWLPLHFAVMSNNIEAAVSLVIAFPNALAMENDDEESPLEKCEDPTLIREVMNCHPEAPAKIAFVLRSNRKAIVNAIPQSEGWKISDLKKYFQANPKLGSNDDTEQKCDLSDISDNDGDMKSNGKYPSLSPSSRSNDLEKSSLVSSAPPIPSDESLREKDRVISILKRESNISLEFKDEEIVRLTSERNRFRAQLTETQAEVQRKEDAMESVRMDLAKKILKENQHNDEVKNSYGETIREVAELRVELTTVQKEKSEEVKAAKLQRQKSVAEVKGLKEKLKESARLMKMLRDENKSTVSNLSLASSGQSQRVLELQSEVDELNSEKTSLQEEFSSAKKKLKEVIESQAKLLAEMKDKESALKSDLASVKSAHSEESLQKDKKVDELNALMLPLQREICVLQKQLKESKEDNESTRRDHEDVNRKNSKEIRRLENLNDILERKLEETSQFLDEKEKSMIALKAVSENESGSNNKQIQELKTILERKQEELLKTTIAMKHLEEVLKTKSTQDNNNEKHLSSIEAEKEKLERTLTENNKKLEEKISIVAELEKSLLTIKTEHAKIKEENKSLAKQLEESLKINAGQNRKLKRLEKNCSLMEKDLDEAGRRIASLELQNDALENKTVGFWNTFACG